MALELSATRWLLVFGIGMASAVRRKEIAAGDRRALRIEIQAAKARFRVAASVPVRSCYEAGRDGFWIARLLAAEEVTNLVVDSSSLEVNRRQRHAKTDRIDGEKLLRMLIRHWSGERDLWKVVHVPSPETEDARHAERAIAALMAERTRQRNRIHALLALQGIRQRLTRQLGDRWAQLTDWAGVPLRPGVLARLQLAWRSLVHVETELRAARKAQRAAVRAAATPAAVRARRLQQLRGIKAGSALMLAKEVFVRDLTNRRQVGALSGFVAVPYRSGAAQHDQGISRAGLRQVRRVMVELAWAWVQWQPTSALSLWFGQRFGHGGRRARRIGIVAMARKLLIALWRYSEQGIVPEGAVLR
jgi:transposase